MKNRRILFPFGILVMGIFVFFLACKDDTYEYKKSQGSASPYDPNTPVTVTGFMPDSGKIREKVVIHGTNFGNDISKVKVSFNDGTSDKEAIVINVDGTSIYCLAPRQNGGNNQIKVSIAGSEAAAASNTFRYIAAANVSWVSGQGKSQGAGARYNDGTLVEANYWKLHGIVYLGNGVLLTTGWYESQSNKVRITSIEDDQVVTVQDGAWVSKPTANEDKTRAYTTTLNPPHTVYEYRKEAGWAPYILGEINVPKYPWCCDRIRSLVMMDKANDPNQEWLYFAHKDKTFGRYNIETNETQILADETLDVPVKNWPGYLTYDKFKDCFYLSLHESYSIYKITKTGADWGDGVRAELYAGVPAQSSVTDGTLENARFKEPLGMCLDEEGNLYVCDGGSNVIRKISAIDGYVSTVAGKVGVEGSINGDPLEATFLVPYDICYDDDGNFYIAEFWESTIRKYAVE